MTPVARKGRVRGALFALGLVLPFLASVGCGRSPGDVAGTVRYKTKPLPFGWVRAQGSDGLLKDGRIQPDGSYRIEGLPTGEAKFVVSCVDPRIEAYTKEMVGRQRPGGRDNPRIKFEGSPDTDPFAKFYLIPRDYEDITKSQLVLQVESGANTYDIDLK